MEEFEVAEINAARMNEPYGSQQEMLRDMFAVLDYHLYVYYRHHQWLGPENDMRNMLGLMVTREEFEHNLSGSGGGSLSELAEEQEKEALRSGIEICAARLSLTPQDEFPVTKLIRRFDMNLFQTLSFMLAYATQVDERYEKMCAYLQDDVTKKYPSPMLCIHLFADGGIRSLTLNAKARIVGHFDTET